MTFPKLSYLISFLSCYAFFNLGCYIIVRAWHSTKTENEGYLKTGSTKLAQTSMDNCFSAYHVLTMATQGKNSTNKLIYFNLYPQILYPQICIHFCSVKCMSYMYILYTFTFLHCLFTFYFHRP